MDAWKNCVEPPVKGRSEKPRQIGLTMILDKGLGLRATGDLVETAGPWIDVLKFSFGTSYFYSRNLCLEKVEILKAADILVMPGGTYLEVAVWQGQYDAYLKRAKELGFNAVEVSDGTIDIDLETRADLIKKAVDSGFRVFTEVGKKDPAEEIPLSVQQNIIRKDLNCGAFKVIVEAREAGKGVGIFDKEGKVKEEEIDGLLSGVSTPDDLLWEAPIKNQQQLLILKLGTNVNLGNIPPADIIALESLRQGLRGDTLKKAYLEQK
jgi:phosphosulfolactate synthase